MAIIGVTQKNFTKVISEKLDKMGVEGLFASALMGGKDKMKEAIADVPDENTIWVNTDHVVAASTPMRVAETGDVVFRIYFRHPDEKNNAVWIKADDYKRFILAWAGELKCLTEGDYEVPVGYEAISYEDGKKVKVVKIKED